MTNEERKKEKKKKRKKTIWRKKNTPKINTIKK